MGLEPLAVALLSLVWPGSPSFVLAGSFEGVVVMKRTSDGEVSTHKRYFKGERNGDHIVWDSTTNEGFVVEPQERRMMVHQGII